MIVLISGVVLSCDNHMTGRRLVAVGSAIGGNIKYNIPCPNRLVAMAPLLEAKWTVIAKQTLSITVCA